MGEANLWWPSTTNFPKSLDTYDIKIKDVYKLDIFDGLATLNEFISEAHAAIRRIRDIL